MRRIAILTVLILFLIVGIAHARQNLSADTFAGGGTDPWALDRFVTLGSGEDDDCSAPGCSYNALADGDAVLVFDYTNLRAAVYVYDIDSAQSETVDDPPNFIQPDYTEAVGTPTAYTGDGRWVMIALIGSTITTMRTSTPQIIFRDADCTDNDNNVIIEIECSDTGSNTEDCDIIFKQQINGVETTVATFDADDKLDVVKNLNLADTYNFYINDVQLSLHHLLEGTGMDPDFLTGDTVDDNVIDPGLLPDASTTVEGVSELATDAETSTGTDTVRTITPDALAGSIFGQMAVCFIIADNDVAVTTSLNGEKRGLAVDAMLNGFNLIDVTARVHTLGGTSGETTVNVVRRRGASNANMCSSGTTVGYNEYYAADETVDTGNDDLATGDWISIDVTGIPSGGAPSGLSVTLMFRKP